MKNEYKIVESRSGTPTLLCNGKYLHSKYDPVAEAHREIESIIISRPSAVVVLGIGLGYVIDALLDAPELKNTKILAVEADPELFNLSERTRGLRREERLYYLVGRNKETNFDTITRCIDSVSASKIEYIHRLSHQAPEFYSEIASIITRVAKMHIESLNSMVKFGSLWWENSVRNYREWALRPDVGDWFGAFRNTPIIVFAAGPTLQDNLELFTQGEGGIRFAVDTAYPILERAGVKIDLVLAVDAQKLTIKHFEGTRPKLLAAAPVIPPELWNVAEHSLIMSLDGPHFSWFEERLNRHIAKLKSGGSVTTFAFDLARRMGSPKIILVGADFSYRDGKTHSPGTIYDKIEIEMVNRFQTPELQIFRNMINLEGVTTDEQLAQYAQWMKWEIANTRAEIYRVIDFGLLKEVPVIKIEELKRIISSEKRELFIPKPPRLDIRRLIEGFKIEKRALKKALEGDIEALRRLSGFFDLIVRPFATVSQREILSESAIGILMEKLKSAYNLLDEIISNFT